MWVVNVHEESSGPDFGSGTREQWRGMRKSALCSVLTCGHYAEVKGQVQKVDASDPGLYFIGLCRGHKREPGLMFEISDATILRPVRNAKLLA
jgi:hypothetical protein